jgi:hypothetical protein
LLLRLVVPAGSAPSSSRTFITVSVLAAELPVLSYATACPLLLLLTLLLALLSSLGSSGQSLWPTDRVLPAATAATAAGILLLLLGSAGSCQSPVGCMWLLVLVLLAQS